MLVVHISSTARQGGGPYHILSLLTQVSYPNLFSAVIIPDNERLSYSLYHSASYSYPFPKSIRSTFSLFFFLRAKHREHSPVKIHSHGPGACLLGKLLKFLFGFHHIYTPHGIQISSYSALKHLIYILYEHLTSFLIDQIIYISHTESQYYFSKYLFTRIPFSTIENVVNPSKIFQQANQTDLSPIHSHKSATPLVGMIGRLCAQKNSPFIFTLCAALPEVDFVYVGEGGDLESHFLSCLHERSYPNLTYIPNVTNIASIYRDIDLLVAPSSHEGLPYVVIEALCNYIPVVCSSIPPFEDLYLRFPSPLIHIVGNTSTSPLFINSSDFISAILKLLSIPRESLVSDSLSQELVRYYSDSSLWASRYTTEYLQSNL